LKFHLFICNACTHFNQQLRLIKNAIERIKIETENDSSLQLSLDAKARINQVVESNH
jgi:hypothetical protein